MCLCLCPDKPMGFSRSDLNETGKEYVPASTMVKLVRCQIVSWANHVLRHKYPITRLHTGVHSHVTLHPWFHHVAARVPCSCFLLSTSTAFLIFPHCAKPETECPYHIMAQLFTVDRGSLRLAWLQTHGMSGTTAILPKHAAGFSACLPPGGATICAQRRLLPWRWRATL